MSELRLGRKADAVAFHALLQAAKDEIGLNWRPNNDDWYVKWIEDHCIRRAVWVVENNNEISGAMLMEINEIFYLVVSEKYRRKGVGRVLIRKAKQLCANKRWDYLKGQARRENTPILRLLDTEGFRLDRTLQTNKPDWDYYTWVRRPHRLS